MKQPDIIDSIIAENLKRYRLEKEMSMKNAGGMIGVSYQQMQKYENGKNRICASHLWKLSIVYRVPIQRFFGR